MISNNDVIENLIEDYNCVAASGCINCFCMGIPSASGQASCKPSQLFRDKVCSFLNLKICFSNLYAVQG